MHERAEVFRGTIIAESLERTDLLERLHIVRTVRVTTTARMRTPWTPQWTMHTVEVDAADIEDVAAELSRAIDPIHADAWYADLRNEATHYIVFRLRVFAVARRSADAGAAYAAAAAHGRMLGIPEHQLDFEPTDT